MTIHEIKLRIEFCDAVYTGEKTFEVRRNDRGYQKGDLVHFIPTALDEYGAAARTEHPIDNRVYEIRYVINGWGLRDGFIVFGIRDVTDDPFTLTSPCDAEKCNTEA